MKELDKTLILPTVVLLILPIQYSAQFPIHDEKSLRSSSMMENTEEVTFSDDDDYPSDTHGGAVKAFSQLVSSDDSNVHSSLSISSKTTANSNDLNNVEGKEDIGTDDQHETGKNDKGDDEEDNPNDEGLETCLKLGGSGDEDDSEIDTQYLLEEFYGYTYDEALEDDDDIGDGRRNKNNNDYEY